MPFLPGPPDTPTSADPQEAGVVRGLPNHPGREWLALGLACAALGAWVSPVQAQEGVSGPVVVDGQAQVVPAFSDSSHWVRHDLWVETEFDSDGDGRRDRVHVAVTRPGQTDSEALRVPVIYESSPYYSGTGSGDLRYFWDVRHEVGATPPERNAMPSIPHQSRRRVITNSHVSTWLPRGFAVVHSQSPGTGLSQGCPTVGGDNESLAPKAVIDWLNGRARGFTSPAGGDEVEAFWTTGRVGMTGTSYNGTLPLAAATTGVDGLEAIIPVAPNTSYYHYYRSHGLVRSPGGWLGEDIDVLFDFINSGDPDTRPYCEAEIRDGLMKANQDRVTGDHNEFWAGRDYLPGVENVQAAVLMSHAFNDWNVMPEHSVRIYEALKARGVPSQIYLHQGGHGGPPPLEMMNRWFTRYVLGVENGVEQDPRAWVVREGHDRLQPTPYGDYPNPAASPVTLYPRGGTPGVGGLALEPTPQQGVGTVVDNVSFSGGVLAQAEWTEHRLLFATDELTHDLHISGTPVITLRVGSDKPAVNLSVWLVSLPWAGAPSSLESVVTRGWADPQNHRSLEAGEALQEGRFYDLTFTLQPTDKVVPEGKRLALMIFSSDREFTLWPHPGTRLQVDLDATHIVVPVVGGETSLTLR